MNGVTGLLDPAKWIAENFERDSDGGVFVYKRIGPTEHRHPSEVKPGSFITETCNPNRTTNCGSGVNVGTYDYCSQFYTNSDLWLCKIYPEDLPGLVVPYGTTGFARAARVQLIRIVE